MYDVKSFNFRQEDCWFKNNCKEYKDKEKCKCSCPVYFQYYYLVNLANIPKRMQYPENQVLLAGADISEYKRLSKIKDNIFDWVANGSNAVIHSGIYGNGKTTWAIKLMSAYFSKIWNGNGTKCRGLFINVDEFLMQKQNNIDDKNTRFSEMEKLIPEVDLVIWDDIGCTQLTRYQHNILFPLINSRIINGKSNIFTTNHGDDLAQNVGDRLASRILDTSEQFEFKNESKRGL